MPTVKLTTDFIKNNLICPEGKSRIEYCDTEVRGLYCAVSQISPGRGTFFLRWKNSRGVTAHSKICRTDDLPLAEVRKRALALKADIFRGSDPQELLRQTKAVPTFGDFFTAQYLPIIKLKNRTWKNAEEMFNARLKDRFGSTRLDKITRQEVQLFHLSLHESGLSGATSDHHLKLLRHVYNVAISFDVTGRNPAAKVPLLNVDNKRERYVRDDELPRLLHVLRTDSNRAVCSMVLLLLCTGMRVGEAKSAEWSDVNFETRTLTIKAINAKAKKARHVALNDAAIEVLKQLPRRTGQTYLFRSPQTGKRLMNIEKVWARLRIEAGVPDLRLHDIRHTYASMLINGGNSLYIVSKALGHANVATSARYSHVDNQTLQAAADTVAQKLANASVDQSEAA